MSDEGAETALVMRPWVAATVEREADRLGRDQPRRLGVPALAHYWLRVGIQRRPVPSDYWALDLDDAGFSVAEVSCPCGKVAIVPAGGLATCLPASEMTTEYTRGDTMPECPRAYVFTGEDVFVYNSPIPEPQTPAAS